ncbi:GDP-mannose 4,6-dehydratase [Conexibacter sp. JD483]|uniref:GDP-mannose 4,6-dehydratase n=1 Tax=unclassified Conexibacter TaxID=2627773 RepID=UPI002717188E|nr:MULTISPECIES: GDP-mannose 4,6-dehydratase [unclassified Conexibacter]MDO8184059.1 GDP-mannose 4,6-dehydratase [Conexibacter sp. CPCC 205706]MDO8197051.1 GDP-mannose 4,6-dehydratase [Conexibacter sp. CPCC 205762]MDR9367967.1 GDP-mannose 4,6-dehydratase [Conexibacter sp. JD483]
MSRRVLITGVTGQDGGYLAEQLLAGGDEVLGTIRPGRDGDEALASAGLGHLRGRLELLPLDLLDPASVRAAIAAAQPDELYHLAAPTFVPDSWDDPTEVVSAVAGGTAAVLAAASAQERPVRVLVASSSEVFGDAGVSPQSERAPMRPRSPYGVAKLAAHGLVGALRARHDRFLVSAITFNHESPRRPERFLPRKVTAGVAAIAAGRAETLTLGDLAAVRDWSHARDVVAGMVLALRHEEPSDWVFASGMPHTVGDLVDTAFAAAGVGRHAPDGSDRVKVDPRFVRPPERWPPVGDPARARELLGWQPRTGFEQLVGEMVAADLRLLEAA